MNNKQQEAATGGARPSYCDHEFDDDGSCLLCDHYDRDHDRRGKSLDHGNVLQLTEIAFIWLQRRIEKLKPLAHDDGRIGPARPGEIPSDDFPAPSARPSPDLAERIARRLAIAAFNARRNGLKAMTRAIYTAGLRELVEACQVIPDDRIDAALAKLAGESDE